MHIQTNEVLLRQDDRWIRFSRPRQIISTDKLDEVIPCLREIERRVEIDDLHAAGFVSYEAASAFEPAHRSRPIRGFPLIWFGLYPQPDPVSLPQPGRYHPLDWHPTIDRETYNAAIAKIKDYIAQGRTYQVNYTMRLQTEFHDDAWDFFLNLAQTQNAYAAYIDMGRYAVCSASPELFFQLDGRTITGKPMKGTVKRGRTTGEDQELSSWLQSSVKNRAENVMIVDMIRNDLGRIAEIGSVQVPKLFTVERYPTLWQMTSTVTARTRGSIAGIFTALFPCASITGAPKVSTMKFISELETTPRKIYTGSIGHIAPNRKATFNVAIRTALIDRETHQAEYGVGGGIVWDSTSADEYDEALLKARVLTERKPEFSLLETLVWTPEEGFFLREKHIARMLDSADYFDFPVSSNPRWSSRREAAYRDDPATREQALLEETTRSRYVSPANDDTTRPPDKKELIETYLDQMASHFTTPQRVRLLLDRNGDLSSEFSPYFPQDKPLRARLADKPIDSNEVFLFHKTTHREVYDKARSPHPLPLSQKERDACDDVLLFNERGELTEFTIGNLVVEREGKFYTPPISCGLLAGTFRAHLLETGQVEEKTIRVEELKECGNIFLVNSVRRRQEVMLV